MIVMVGILFVFFVLSIPFIHGFGYFDIYELPKFIWMIYLIVAGMIYVFFSKRDNWRSIFKSIYKKHIFWLIAAFGAIHLLSSCLSPDGLDYISLFGQPYRYNGIIFYVALALLFLFMIKIMTDFRDVKIMHIVYKIVIFSGALIALHLLLDFAAIHTDLWFVPDYLGRPVGSFGNPNHAGGYIAMLMAFLMASSKNKKTSIYSFAYMSLLLAGIIATGSLSALLSIFVVFILVFFDKDQKSVLTYVFIIGLLAASIATFVFIKNNNYQNTRQEIWGKSLKAIYAKPLFGWGIEKIDVAIRSQLGPTDFYMKEVKIDRTHNIWLDTAIQVGIFGALARAAMVIYTLLTLAFYKKEILANSALYVLVAFEIFALFNVVGISQYIFLLFSFAAFFAMKALKFGKSI